MSTTSSNNEIIFLYEFKYAGLNDGILSVEYSFLNATEDVSVKSAISEGFVLISRSESAVTFVTLPFPTDGQFVTISDDGSLINQETTYSMVNNDANGNSYHLKSLKSAQKDCLLGEAQCDIHIIRETVDDPLLGCILETLEGKKTCIEHDLSRVIALKKNPAPGEGTSSVSSKYTMQEIEEFLHHEAEDQAYIDGLVERRKGLQNISRRLSNYLSLSLGRGSGSGSGGNNSISSFGAVILGSALTGDATQEVNLSVCCNSEGERSEDVELVGAQWGWKRIVRVKWTGIPPLIVPSHTLIKSAVNVCGERASVEVTVKNIDKVASNKRKVRLDCRPTMMLKQDLLSPKLKKLKKLNYQKKVKISADIPIGATNDALLRIVVLISASEPLGALECDDLLFPPIEDLSIPRSAVEAIFPVVKIPVCVEVLSDVVLSDAVHKGEEGCVKGEEEEEEREGMKEGKGKSTGNGSSKPSSKTLSSTSKSAAASKPQGNHHQKSKKDASVTGNDKEEREDEKDGNYRSDGHSQEYLEMLRHSIPVLFPKTLPGEKKSKNISINLETALLEKLT
ncbi:hypothetical protein ADUPG1_012608 [Aduncisulcus paluster]|uniref:Uncharacterized protein n=1 Tax=Aduncisulcus paluster TaxID=2918883 RepID=A0ABQ5K006_9EUKA|nr:hypothetical protein ADUPG1_012608 [Aduncisulcus paluster]